MILDISFESCVAVNMITRIDTMLFGIIGNIVLIKKFKKFIEYAVVEITNTI